MKHVSFHFAFYKAKVYAKGEFKGSKLFVGIFYCYISIDILKINNIF